MSDEQEAPPLRPHQVTVRRGKEVDVLEDVTSWGFEGGMWWCKTNLGVLRGFTLEGRDITIIPT